MLCHLPHHLYVRLPASSAKVLIYKLEAEADEMWSLMQKKANKQWIWPAMDATTFHTDQYEVYKGVIPAERHHAITNIERF